jgi:hypothetical protein
MPDYEAARIVLFAFGLFKWQIRAVQPTALTRAGAEKLRLGQHQKTASQTRAAPLHRTVFGLNDCSAARTARNRKTETLQLAVLAHVAAHKPLTMPRPKVAQPTSHPRIVNKLALSGPHIGSREANDLSDRRIYRVLSTTPPRASPLTAYDT